MRQSLARSYDLMIAEPDIQAVDVDLGGDRLLHLQHAARDGVPLREQSGDAVLRYVRFLWGYDVQLTGVDPESGRTVYERRTGETDGKKS